MKKMLIGFFAVMLAMATAFANHSAQPQLADPLLYWFEEDGDYIDQEYYSVMHQLCPNNGEVCAEGFTDFDEVNGKIVSAGTLEETVRFP